MNPLGVAVTPDGKYIITTNDDERNNGPSPHSGLTGGYTLTVVNASTLAVVSHLSATPVVDPTGAPVLTAKGAPVTVAVGKLFIGLQVTGAGPYTVYASGGGDNSIKLFTVTAAGVISQNGQNAVTSGTTYTFVPQTIALTPITPQNAGFASNYVLSPGLNAAVNSAAKTTAQHDLLPHQRRQHRAEQLRPAAARRHGNGSRVVFPAGSALHGRFLYVACNGDNSVAVIDTLATNQVIKPPPRRLLPLRRHRQPRRQQGAGLQLGRRAVQVPGRLLRRQRPSDRPQPPSRPARTPRGLFFVPTSPAPTGTNPQTSSVSVISVPGGDPTKSRADPARCRSTRATRSANSTASATPTRQPPPSCDAGWKRSSTSPRPTPTAWA